MNKIEEELDKRTKKELIDIIYSIIEDYSLSEDILDNYITAKDLTSTESIIMDKIKNTKDILTDEEKKYIKDLLSKKQNIKISSAIKNTNKFLAFLIETKINKYFDLCWKIYPRAVGKQLGKKSFYKLLEDRKVSQLDDVCKYIYNKVQIYQKMCKDNGTEEQYILHFSTFCNSKKYL